MENAEAKPKASTWTIDEDDALEDIPIVSTPSSNNTWKINNDDDDVIDEDLLLDEIDKQVVSVLPVSDDCENSATAGKRGACKNCTCGRADMKEEEIENTKSSCGNVRYHPLFLWSQLIQFKTQLIVYIFLPIL